MSLIGNKNSGQLPESQSTEEADRAHGMCRLFLFLGNKASNVPPLVDSGRGKYTKGSDP